MPKNRSAAREIEIAVFLFISWNFQRLNVPFSEGHDEIQAGKDQEEHKEGKPEPDLGE
jgi:hypothetical protein